jgi:hypothetical protein
MRKATVPAGIAVLAVFAVTATSSASFAQAGSTGGTIGKTDKSLSGDEDTESQHQLQREAPSRHPIEQSHEDKQQKRSNSQNNSRIAELEGGPPPTSLAQLRTAINDARDRRPRADVRRFATSY